MPILYIPCCAARRHNLARFYICSPVFNCKYCVPIVYIPCCAARRHNLARFYICSPVFNCKYCVCRLYIFHVVQPADITLQGFISAAQFLTVNSGGRFFNRTPSVLLSSTSERPSTAKTTQHPDPSIDPQVDHLIPPLTPHSPFVPATSCPESNIDPQVDQAYLAPHPPPPPPRLPHGFNYNISKTSLLYKLSLICL